MFLEIHFPLKSITVFRSLHITNTMPVAGILQEKVLRLDASKIAIEVLNSGFDCGHGKIIYNKFRTVVSYNLSAIPIFSLKSVESSDKLCHRFSRVQVINFKKILQSANWIK